MCIENVYDPEFGLRGELCRVTYLFDKETKTVRRRAATKAEGLAELSAKSTDMLGAVEAEDFGFEYCYKKPALSGEIEVEWKNTWDEKNTDKIPRGVRIRLGEYKKTVFIPTGELGTQE
jgi:hypothetical protein